jgi:hypothetical protein
VNACTNLDATSAKAVFVAAVLSALFGQIIAGSFHDFMETYAKLS